MCRHLAWLGHQRSLHDVVVAAPYSLFRQSWAPRRQRHGTINADGFGVGWYVDGRAEPVRYRRAQPIWTDASFASLAPTVASGCVLASVRSATPGLTYGEAAAAPFLHGRWMFSHNGRLADLDRARKVLWPQAAEVPEAQVGVDSAWLFGAAVGHWTAGSSLADGLVAVTRLAQDAGGGRVSLLATDGSSVAATVLGEPMYVRELPSGVLVASEPSDDEDGWVEIPYGHRADIRDGQVSQEPMDL
ncbi:MAG TPA: ergothioneine biosynthesis protein EgtC [Nocardioidaceae bacterium]|nr:ergothioneine biosynthesis protein EgtC [Nocardioidaceae bacterium]